jgi:hypothetical protein
LLSKLPEARRELRTGREAGRQPRQEWMSIAAPRGS